MFDMRQNENIRHLSFSFCSLTMQAHSEHIVIFPNGTWKGCTLNVCVPSYHKQPQRVSGLCTWHSRPAQQHCCSEDDKVIDVNICKIYQLSVPDPKSSAHSLRGPNAISLTIIQQLAQGPRSVLRSPLLGRFSQEVNLL